VGDAHHYDAHHYDVPERRGGLAIAGSVRLDPHRGLSRTGLN
jgi:hypothetical protein